jgi:hypothetical protein
MPANRSLKKRCRHLDTPRHLRHSSECALPGGPTSGPPGLIFFYHKTGLTAEVSWTTIQYCYLVSHHLSVESIRNEGEKEWQQGQSARLAWFAAGRGDGDVFL